MSLDNWIVVGVGVVAFSVMFAMSVWVLRAVRKTADGQNTGGFDW